MELLNSIHPGQWLIFITIIVGFASAFFKFRPDQTRAETEREIAEATVVAAAKVAAAAAVAEAKLADDAATAKQLKEFRDEVHGYKNQVAKLLAAQLVSDRKVLELEKLLTHALSTSSMRRDQMNAMMSLIEMLIAELERIDPKSIIVPQAKALLKQMREAAQRPSDPLKSDSMNSAEHAVLDAEQTVVSARATREDVRQSEKDEK